jgi:hypothetical protein
MATGQLLIIAPELDLRKSLEFLLESDGYAVVSRPRIDFAAGREQELFACTVLDQKALVGPTGRIIEFCRASHPVVLLSDRRLAWLEPHVTVTVDKPLAGHDLAGAVRQAIAAPPPQRH